MRVSLLGTGAPLHPTRATLGLLLEAPDCAPLLVDTCGGFELARALARLGYRDERLADLGNVVVTHRHGDHIGGMMALHLAVEGLEVYGPKDALAGVETLLGLYPHYGRARAHRIRYTATRPGEAYELGGFSVHFFEVVHRVPTLAVRVEHGGKVLAYSADSLPCAALVDCAKDADLFICDALCAASDAYAEHAPKLMHPTALEAAETARRAGAGALALVHQVRYATPKRMLAEAREVFGGPVTLPEDGTTLTV